MISDAESSGGKEGGEYPIGKMAANSIEQMAVKHGWPVPADKKQAIVDRQIDIATNGKDRTATAAARVLVSMEAQNIAANIDTDRTISPHEVAAELIAMRRATIGEP